ncbi:hypothetical protein [Micromonospora sp. NPDC051006]|uniref:hypothetical protein n=1 Tax=Micromonospora sp. NPDC051006 TaxID=3364283 RepID=UPI00379A662A
MTRGEMYTITAHVLPHGEPNPGGWHCRITGDERDGKVVVQQMRLDGTRWTPGMSTSVYVTALRPLAVQVDLFGDPAPPAGARRPTNRIAA